MIAATKDKPVRLVFHNLLPTGSDGDLFMPMDSTLMGAGMGPMGMPDPVDEGSVLDEVRNPVCDQSPKPADCYKDNRAASTCTAASARGSATARRTSGSRLPTRTRQWPQGDDVRVVPDMSDGTSPRTAS